MYIQGRSYGFRAETKDLGGFHTSICLSFSGSRSPEKWRATTLGEKHGA